MRKTRIIDELGDRALLLPEQVNAALTANDHVKYCFSLLQAARGHAATPAAPAADLQSEREAAGIDDATLDSVPGSSARAEDGGLQVPRAGEIHGRILAGVEAMLVPLRAAGAPAAAAFDQRLTALVAALPAVEETHLSADYVGAVTHARREAGDSLHLLVMDLHKALNDLQGELAVETIGGARVYALEPEDRPRVAAFMSGLGTTAPLKFDHPGLETTATRSAGTLLLQNDIGTTDAHVLVVRVRSPAADLTYTDVHAERTAFFKSLFERWAVAWDDTVGRSGALAEGELYFTCTGRYEAADEAELDEFLRFLGSRIVFLIDWNKARKRLRNFLRKRDCLEVLRWAAEHDHGHRGFLQLGGERVVYEALEGAGATRMRLGQRLDEVLGREQAVEFLKFVLRTAAAGLLAGRSERLIRDEIRAELLGYFQTAREAVLATVSEHAVLIADLALAVRDELVHWRGGASAAALERTARRAKAWESRADALVNRAREAARGAAETAFFGTLVEQADDAADALEDAAYLLSLMPAAPAPVAEPLDRLAEQVLAAAREYVKCIESAGLVQHGGPREDTRDFLEAVDRIVTLEHETDDAERELTTALVTAAVATPALFLHARIANTLEDTADVLGRCALMLRDRLLGDVLGA